MREWLIPYNDDAMPLRLGVPFFVGTFPGTLRWPDGFRCRRCVEPVGVAAEHRSVGVLGVRPAELGDGGDDVLSHPDAAADVVCRGVDDDQPEARVSALGVQRALGLGSYQTAWAMLHRYRSAMVRPGRERLSGRVEVDETWIGGVERGLHGRDSETKSLVAIAVEIKHPKGFGRVRMQRVEAIRKEYLMPFVCAAVEPGATIHSDGNQAYWTVPEHGYEHERTVLASTRIPRMY